MKIQRPSHRILLFLIMLSLFFPAMVPAPPHSDLRVQACGPAEKRFATAQAQQKAVKPSQEHQTGNQTDTLIGQKFIQHMLGFIAIIIVVFAALMMYSHRRLRIINQQLRKANAQVAKQKNTLADISDRQTQLLKDLKASNAAKDRFFSIIAHDLKNPLQVQLSGTRLLSEQLSNLNQEEIYNIVEEMKSNTKHLFNLLDNLLQWAQVQTGQIKHQPVNVNLSEVMKRWLMFYRSAAEQKSILLSRDIASHVHVMADRFMINSILNNLISNALKFTEAGGQITLRTTANPPFWTITVQDTGVGISEARLEKLFSIDENISTRGTANEKGTGLGMILCREFAIINGGDLSIESREGQGTTVRLKLPKTEATAQDSHPVQEV